MYKDKRIHMIGIGGISMSGIAMMLVNLGAIVTGSDQSESKITTQLQENGINVFIGSNPELIDNCDIVVYTAAIQGNDLELKRAKELHKECYERAYFLGRLMTNYNNRICISGTHGKSTTTGLVSAIFLNAKKDPTIQIGAIIPLLNKNYRIGSNEYLIMEACEYVDSFLHFLPTCEVITNIDDDHLDYFKNLDNIKKSFKAYTELIPDNGFLVINNDDENSKCLLETNKRVITYGINNESNYMAKNIDFNDLGYARYDLYFNNTYLVNIELNIPGIHNVYNSLAAFAVSKEYILDIDTIKLGIKEYKGVERRFQTVGKYKSVLVIDDYAHHPTELITTLKSSKNIKCNQTWAVFQSHTYSRTKEHLDEFASILSQFDNIVIAPIYPARETNIFNISESMLVDKIKEINKNVIYIDSFSKIVNYLKENVKDNDVVITIGAGPINKVALELIK